MLKGAQGGEGRRRRVRGEADEGEGGGRKGSEGGSGYRRESDASAQCARLLDGTLY